MIPELGLNPEHYWLWPQTNYNSSNNNNEKEPAQTAIGAAMGGGPVGGGPEKDVDSNWLGSLPHPFSSGSFTRDASGFV